MAVVLRGLGVVALALVVVLLRKLNIGHIKQYVNRKREVSECDNDEKDGRNEQGGAPVKRQRSEVSETQTSSTTKSAHKVRDLEVTEVKEAELVNLKRTEWQQEMCGRFNLTLKRKSRYSHLNPPSPISIDHEPQKTTRIRGDGNCFFRTVSHIVSGDQEEHASVRIAIVRYLRQNPQVFLIVSYLIHRPWINISCRAKWKLHARGPQRWKYLPQQHF